ncbi:nucleotidyl transferase AbiEii/AbiGii toxin family protein [Candidatus Poriferisocius sp.]|uniref:nucleotidyl transferase AbiEii/AbiGii toxin family protein n=1 Tax=Candidatus Poriferisocius sp. TaxID=3101276 RepID=UPI003B023216
MIEESTGIPAAHVEKDFWVTEALRAAAARAASEKTTIVFKGGTSLSKAHRLIRRFSEDIDLLVVVPGDSKDAADRCLKAITAAVGKALGVEGAVDATTATKGRKRTTCFEYPVRHRQGGLRPSVLLELGARGGTLPAEAMTIGSLIAENGRDVGLDMGFEEAASFQIRVLHTARTLVEKLMILHHAAVLGDRAERIRLARHYYDVWCLLNDASTLSALTVWPCDALAREVETFTIAAGLDTSPRPSGGFGASPAFSARTRAVREAYQRQVLDQLVWGPAEEKPTLDECCDLVVATGTSL